MPAAIYIHNHVQQVIDLYQEVLDNRNKQTTVCEELSAMAAVLHEAHKKGNVSTKIQLSNWHPELVGKSTEHIMNADLTRADFELTIAREHAYDTWAQVKTWGKLPFNFAFENSVDVLLSGDVDQLLFLLRRHPRLINERSVYNHRATLLHYIGSNGVETRRQIVPYNLPYLTKVLLELGADRHATAFLYQSQCTTLELLTSSAHPADAGVMTETAALLKPTTKI